MKTLKAIVSVLICAAGAMVASSSSAGYKYNLEVNVSSTTGQGVLGAARASADSTQYIGCTVVSYATGGSTGYCYARNSAGTSISCQTTNASLIHLIQTLNGQSQLYFYVPTGTSTCSQINVYQLSYNTPSTP